MVRLATLTALSLVVACTRGGDQGSGFSSGVSTQPVGSSSSGESGPSSTSTSSSTSSDGVEDSSAGSLGSSSGSPLDMGPLPDFGPGQPEGCKGKIDFLFLIASNGTMNHEQDQLLGSFDGFMETIGTKFADFDTHIMSVNVSGKWNGYQCENADYCGTYGYCGPSGKDYVCGSHVDVWPCDNTLGAGLLFNAGSNATNHVCELHGGNRYIVGDDPDPVEAFKCIATVGGFGADPPLADSLVAAVSAELNGPEGCNAGFLRDDALLVFVFIMDSDDEKSKLKPAQVYDAVVAAKGGDPNSIVALAVLPQPPEGEPAPDCVIWDYLTDQHLDLVIREFPYHDQSNICAPSYAPFFDKAAGLVGEACSNFIPQ